MTYEERMKWFNEARFGIYIHFGLYSLLGRGEWTMYSERIPAPEYAKLADSFLPAPGCAKEWAETARAAGAKYMVLTTRHHEGFSLYDTCGLSEFDVMHTPCGRDLVREYVDACRKHDIVPFFYHTTLDWYNKDFEEDFDKYLDYLNASVEILCKNYGKIGGLWFDGNWSKPEGTDWKEDRLYGTIRKYQPEAMIINNTGLGKRGETGHPEIDSVTFERGRPTPMNREGMSKYIAAEMCDTINDHWGIGFFDLNYKSPNDLISNLCASRKVGANYLLNIGPTAQGGIDTYQRELMKIVGRWTAIFADAVYGAQPYSATCAGQDFMLKKDKKLYLFHMNNATLGNEHVVIGNYYNGSYAFDNVTDTIKSIKWMDDGEELSFVQVGDMLSVKLTGQPYGASYCVRVAEAELA